MKVVAVQLIVKCKSHFFFFFQLMFDVAREDFSGINFRAICVVFADRFLRDIIV